VPNFHFTEKLAKNDSKQSLGNKVLQQPMIEPAAVGGPDPDRMVTESDTGKKRGRGAISKPKAETRMTDVAMMKHVLRVKATLGVEKGYDPDIVVSANLSIVLVVSAAVCCCGGVV
jgi:hypothetical protein